MKHYSAIYKQLDRQFLSNYYGEMVDEVNEIFEIFLQETAGEIDEIKKLFALNKPKDAAEIMHKIIPSFSSIGLPQLSVQLQEIETYVNTCSGAKGLVLVAAFENELAAYMPAIVEEYNRLEKNSSYSN
jgi:HPt (histidine-containing phosphotransfer) domain-containing protein